MYVLNVSSLKIRIHDAQGRKQTQVWQGLDGVFPGAEAEDTDAKHKGDRNEHVAWPRRRPRKTRVWQQRVAGRDDVG